MTNKEPVVLETVSEELLPCPFCGGPLWVGKVETPDGDSGWKTSGYRAWCNDCKTSMHECPTEAEAIAAWNRRSPVLASRLAIQAPDGWQLVPVEPTEAMISAGKDADWVGEVESRAGLSIMPDNTPDWNSDDDQAVISRPGIWQAMIAAAPNLGATK